MPSPRWARLRQGLWSLLLSLLLIAGAAAATWPPPVIAVPLVALVLGTGIFLAARLWRRAHAAVAVSGIGIAVRNGIDTSQIGWPAITWVIGLPRGRRLAIRILGRDLRLETATSFQRELALAWLDACREEAGRRRLGPQPLPDGPGFITGS